MGRPEAPPFINVGDVFTRLRVIEDLGLQNGFGGVRRTWRCLCDCGKTVLQIKSQLVAGIARSCGCLQREAISRTGSHANLKHGHKRGGKETPEYRAWAGMLRRCHNPNLPAYEDYGARGIRVCRRWRSSFENFLMDLGFRPGKEFSLGRIDNNGGYTPKNVRWETLKQQDRNRRSNRFITAMGETLTLVEWSERTGIGRTTLRRRIDLGWLPEDVVRKPLRSGYRR